jgi:GTPase Era involved in 16S rRNA processing
MLKEKINQMFEIAEELNLEDIQLELNLISERLNQANQEIIIPIVGEFSSGKTTLINAITEGKKLETSSKPTTSVIYEIHFGRDEELAQIHKSTGEVLNVNDISTIKNNNLTGVNLIKLFDTSKKIGSSTILVDTPGLSSNDSEHVQALIGYLPKADALILCTDANQQITNSLLEFIKINSLTHLPLFLIITKSDTKTSSEIESIKEYIASNINISIENIISISSTNNKLDEFYGLIENIQANKNNIISNVLKYKLETIEKYLKEYIIDLLDNSESDRTIEKKLASQKRELERLLYSINRLINDTRGELEEVEDNTIREFKNMVSEKLENLIIKKSATPDQEAINIINTTSSLVISNFKTEVRKKLYVLASDRKNTEIGIPLRSLESLNTEDIRMSPLSYNIDLSSAGQQSIKNISMGFKVVAAIGAVVVTAGAASAAIGAVGAGTAVSGAATGIATTVSAVDTISDVASIRSNRRLAQQLTDQARNIPSYIDQVKVNMITVDEFIQQTEQVIPTNQGRGFLENIIGNVGDAQLGKPQRKKMINQYMEGSLLPEFETKMSLITDNLLAEIQNHLNIESRTKVEQLNSALDEMKSLFELENDQHKEKIGIYKKLLNFLNQKL